MLNAVQETTGLMTALKEWSVTIDALASGEQTFLLRKGGIRETNRHFELAQQTFLLYPTRFHETGDLLKPQYRHLLESEDSVGDDAVLLKAWAEVADVFRIDDADTLKSLGASHIWTDHFVEKRVAWKPRHPAELILLRTYRLVAPVSISVEPHHKGCRSWVDLDEPIDISHSAPALSDADWQAKSSEIKALLSSILTQPVHTL